MQKIIVGFMFITLSCVYDPAKPKLIVIKNKSNQNLVLIVDTNSISDDQLFYGTKYFINSDSSYTVYGWPVLGKSKKIGFCFFNADSVYKLIKINDRPGISKKCFLKEYSLDTDKITNIDTLFYSED